MDLLDASSGSMMTGDSFQVVGMVMYTPGNSFWIRMIQKIKTQRIHSASKTSNSPQLLTNQSQEVLSMPQVLTKPFEQSKMASVHSPMRPV